MTIRTIAPRALVALLAAAAVLVLPDGVAHAAPVPASEQLLDAGASGGYGDGMNGAGDSLTVKLSPSDGFPDGTPAAGITATLHVWQCGREVVNSMPTPPAQIQADFAHSPITFDGVASHAKAVAISWSIPEVRGSYAPVTYRVDVQTPGYDSYSLSGSYTGFDTPCSTAYPPSSGSGGPSKAASLVRSWSTKLGKDPVVGKAVSVTATRATDGASVRYLWKVGTRTVKSGTGRRLRIKSAWNGKAVRVVIKVSKGSKAATHRIGFGKAYVASGSTGSCPAGQHWEPAHGPFKAGCASNGIG